MNKKNILTSFALLFCVYMAYAQNTTDDIQLLNYLPTEKDSFQELDKKIAKARSKYNKTKKTYLQTDEGKMFLQEAMFLRWCHEDIGGSGVDCSSFQQAYENAKFRVEQTSAFKEFDKAHKKYIALSDEKLDTQHHC